MRLREDGAMLSLAEHVLAPIWSCHGLRECQGPGVDMQVSSGLTACLGWPLRQLQTNPEFLLQISDVYFMYRLWLFCFVF